PHLVRRAAPGRALEGRAAAHVRPRRGRATPVGHYRLQPEGEDPVPGAITAAARVVIARTGVPFNSVGLNLYRDGRDSVAPHNDHLDALVRGHPIALLSL